MESEESSTDKIESQEKLSIDTLLDHWLADCGIEVTSDSGTTFLVIPIPNRRGHMLDLIQAMISYGYTEEEIRTGGVSTKVVKMCWSDLIKKMSKSKLIESRDIARRQWEGALNEVFTIEMPKYKKSKKVKKEEEIKKDPPKEKTKEELMAEIFEPKGRLVSHKVIDRTDSTNWELLEELGIEPDGSKDE